jgi:DNA-binding CsgD family transcriptional regulator
VRDAILARVDLLSTAGRQVAEAAAVVGGNLPLELLSRVNGGDAGIEELIGSGLLIERGSGLASFQSPVAGEAIYAAIPWTRRRWLHRRAAEALEAIEQDASQMAEHWQAAGESDRARQSLLEGAARSRRLHSHRDAVHLLRRAIDMWTIGHEEADRLAALDQLGDCAQISGQTTDALRAWRELIDSSSSVTNSDAAARALRKIANLHEVNCDWARALNARQDAMAAFGVGGNFAEAAVEGINAAIRLRMSSQYTAALEVLSRASEYVENTERADLKVRIAALKGNLQARLGRVEEGSAAIRDALNTALALNDPALAGEVYQRLADTIERSSRYRNAVTVGLEGVAFCDDHGQPSGTLACLTCMGFILVRSGEWHQAIETSQRILRSPGCSIPARTGALAFLGLIHVMRGQLRKGEKLLLESEVLARRVDHAVGEIHSRWGLAMHDYSAGDNLLAAERCRGILARYRTVDEGHALIPVFRWASTCFANAGDKEGLHACCEVLGEIADSFSNPEGFSALAHAFGEMAWLEGDAARASEHFERSIELIEDWDLPRERVESQLRAATACAAVGRLEAAIELARDAYRHADRLGALPLTKAAAQQLRALGEPLSGARGPRGVRRTTEGGLTARQRQVLTAISQGMTDKEIARRLKLSPRTVEMHVAHALTALDCRNRAEAVRKAGELGVLQTG